MKHINGKLLMFTSFFGMTGGMLTAYTPQYNYLHQDFEKVCLDM